MTEHIVHLLSAYVEGQLHPQRAATIHRHIANCPTCREKLARHERLATDLRLTLGQSPIPQQTQIQQWWIAINGRSSTLAHRPITMTLLPVALSLLLLVIPLMARWSNATPNMLAAPAGPSIASPIADTTLLPPDTPEEITSQPAFAHIAATPAILPDTAIPAVPVPPAPLTQ